MKTPRRTRAREIALQALYRLDMNPGSVAGDVDRFIAARLGHPSLVDFAQGLVAGVHDRRVELDALLDGRAEHWRVARMPATDRAILRLATFEMLGGDVPGPVAVNEAIELAKRYGTADSARFVAGVLGRLLADRGAATPMD